MLKSIFVFILTSFVSYASANADDVNIPTRGRSAWAYSEGWRFESSDRAYFEAKSASIVADCKRNPDSYINFPFGMQLSQVALLDGVPIATDERIDFSAARSFYSQINISCHEAINGNELTWKVSSFSKLFARFNKFPSVGPGVESIRDQTSFIASMGVGSALILMLFLATTFLGKIQRRLLLSMLIACAGTAIYSISFIPGSIGWTPNMLTLHKILLLGSYMALTGILCAYYFDGLLPKWLFIFHHICLFTASVFMMTGSNSSIVQTASSFAFPTGIFVCLYLAFSSVTNRKAVKGTWNRTVIFASPLFIFSSAVVEVLNLLDVTHLPFILPLGYTFSLLSFAVHVNNDIETAYNERDYLRKNLEREVLTKTSELEAALHSLKTTQAELIQNAKLASLGVMSAGIAHEINNSLNFMKGSLNSFTRIIRSSVQESVREEAEKLLEVFKKGIGATIEIVRSLRAYTENDSQTLSLVNLKECVSSPATLLGLNTDGIQLMLQIPDDLVCYSNAVSLNQVILNLMLNSRDAMAGQNKKIISITCRNTVRQSRSFIELFVADNGPGVAPEIREKIFDPFFTTKGIGEGTGLGLYIVAMELKKNGGSISYQAGSESGACFRILLPADEESFRNQQVSSQTGT